MHTKLLPFILIGVGMSLLSLTYSRYNYEATVLGSSDFALGKQGSCEKLLGFDKCYQQIEYKGYPFRALRITSTEKDGNTVKNTSLAGPRGSGFTNNVLLYSGLSWMLYIAIRPAVKKIKR